MSRDTIMNGAVVIGLAVIVSLSWVGSPSSAGWSRFIGSVVFYMGIEALLWFMAHPLVEERRQLAAEIARRKRNLPPE